VIPKRARKLTPLVDKASVVNMDIRSGAFTRPASDIAHYSFGPKLFPGNEMSNSRLNVLTRVADFSLPIEKLESEVSKLPWDAENGFVELSTARLLSVLDRFMARTMTADDLARWAELIECREDIAMPMGVARDAVRNALSMLANLDLESDQLELVVESIRGGI
jgi:hypothetical protein